MRRRNVMVAALALWVGCLLAVGRGEGPPCSECQQPDGNGGCQPKPDGTRCGGSECTKCKDGECVLACPPCTTCSNETCVSICPPCYG